MHNDFRNRKIKQLILTINKSNSHLNHETNEKMYTKLTQNTIHANIKINWSHHGQHIYYCIRSSAPLFSFIQRVKIKSLSGFWFRCQLKPISKKDLWLLKYQTVFPHKSVQRRIFALLTWRKANTFNRMTSKGENTIKPTCLPFWNSEEKFSVREKKIIDLNTKTI